mgnify:CR=1 FL=1
MNKRFERTVNILGQQGLEKLRNSKVLVVGVGGVGSYSCEALARSGIGKLVLADFDVVEESNLNRQIEATVETIGRLKGEVMAERVLSINPDLEVEVRKIYVTMDNAGELLDCNPDFVIDAIDSMDGKIALWKQCQERGIPYVSSMGMARRTDPGQVMVTTLNKTEYDPMARVLRQKARANGLSLSFPVVCSKQTPSEAVRNEEGKVVLGSMIFVPAAAGLTCAWYCVETLLKGAQA